MKTTVKKCTCVYLNDNSLNASKLKDTELGMGNLNPNKKYSKQHNVSDRGLQKLCKRVLLPKTHKVRFIVNF